MKAQLIFLILSFIVVASFAAKVTSPKDCDKWYSGQTHKIKWETDDLDSTVNIEFYEDDDTLIQVIAQDVPNTGEFEWTIPFFQETFSKCDPYIFVSSSSGYSLDYFITGDDAARSKGFTLINPIIWGSVNVGAAASVADTLIKVRWDGEKVHDYDIEYQKQGTPDSKKTINHPYDRLPAEDLNSQVIHGLSPNTTYEFRMRFRVEKKSSPSGWTEWQSVKTYDRLRCTDEMLSAWFSLEVYDNLRSGQFTYPDFCGKWQMAHGYTSSSDFAAIWTDVESKRIFVAWRGTEGDNWRDWLDNIGYLSGCSNYIDWDEDDCKVSYGFGSNYEKTDYDHFDDILKQAVDAGFEQLIVTGHSQGAALATVAALDYELRFGDRIRVSLINYGAPEVGNDHFADIVSDRLKNVQQYALIDENGEPDEVTLLPGSIIDVGFVPLNQGYSFIECPSDCREDGLGILPPFYCHCIGGYWNHFAVANIQPDYEFVGSPNPIPNDWLDGKFHDHNARNGGFSLTGSALIALLSVAFVALF